MIKHKATDSWICLPESVRKYFFTFLYKWSSFKYTFVPLNHCMDCIRESDRKACRL